LKIKTEYTIYLYFIYIEHVSYKKKLFIFTGL
jgi:hypothetical protein